MTSSVSPQAAAAMNALYGGAASIAAQSPVPMSPPGMQTAMATEHHELSPQPARSLQPEMDAANAETPQAETANIDEKIANLEAKLNHTIEKLNADMDGKLVQINERLDRLVNDGTLADTNGKFAKTNERLDQFMDTFNVYFAAAAASSKHNEAAAPAAAASHLVSSAPRGRSRQALRQLQPLRLRPHLCKLHSRT